MKVKYYTKFIPERVQDISYCCESMKKMGRDHNIKVRYNEKDVIMMLRDTLFARLDYCPFCGAKIKIIDYVE